VIFRKARSLLGRIGLVAERRQIPVVGLRDIAPESLDLDAFLHRHHLGHHIAFPAASVERHSGFTLSGTANANPGDDLPTIFGRGDYRSAPVTLARSRDIVIDGARGVCMTSDGALIEETIQVAKLIDPGLSHAPFLRQGVNRATLREAQVITDPVLHCFHGSLAYGHFLYDMLPVIAWCRDAIQQGRLKLLLPWVPDWVMRHLATFGIDRSHCVPRTEPVLLCREVIVANTLTTHNTFRPVPAFTSLPARLLGCDATPWPDHRAGRRVWLSRRNQMNYSDRRLANEDAVLTLVERFGFTVLEPSNLSFREQVAIFAEASIIAGPHGSGFANLMFARPGTAVVDLMPADWIGYWGNVRDAERWLVNVTSLFRLDYNLILNRSRVFQSLPDSDTSGLQKRGIEATVDIRTLTEVIEQVLDHAPEPLRS